MEELTAATFEPLVGADLAVDDGDLRLVLEEVERGPAQPAAPREHPFSLTFMGPGEPILDEVIHRLTHPDLPGGGLDIFLVALGPGGPAGCRYQAVFN